MSKSKRFPENMAQETWTKGGRECFIVLTKMGHFCGYVRFKKRPVTETGYKGILNYAPVHGGITFATEDKAGMLYGFDCAHCDDSTNPLVRDLEWLRNECEMMGATVALAAKYEKRYLVAKTSKARAKVIDAYHKACTNLGAKFKLTDNFGAMINLMFGEL
jgi:hypothetical protein